MKRPTAEELRAAVMAGSVERVRELIAAGANVNSRITGYGWRPLSWAASEGTPAMCEVLLEAGADPNVRDDSLCWPTYDAVGAGLQDNLAVLLRYGGRLDQVGPHGATPLMAAAQAGHRDMVRWLLSQGQSLDTVDFDGDCALHRAARNGCAQVLPLLVPAAGIMVRNGAGATPLHNAVKSYCWRRDTKMEAADFERKFVATVVALKKLGHDVNARDWRGRTPLHYAVLARPLAIQTLVDHGADLEARDAYGQTPLMVCAREMDPSVGNGAEGVVDNVQALFALGADPRAIDVRGATPERTLLTRKIEGLAAVSAAYLAKHAVDTALATAMPRHD